MLHFQLFVYFNQLVAVLINEIVLPAQPQYCGAYVVFLRADKNNNSVGPNWAAGQSCTLMLMMFGLLLMSL